MLKACYVRELTKLSRGTGDKEQEGRRQQGKRLLGHGCLNFFIQSSAKAKLHVCWLPNAGVLP